MNPQETKKIIDAAYEQYVEGTITDEEFRNKAIEVLMQMTMEPNPYV